MTKWATQDDREGNNAKAAKEAKARNVEIVSRTDKSGIDGSDFGRPTSDIGKSRFLASLEMTKFGG